MTGRLLHAAAGPVVGDVVVPGSKSIANRALAIAALADGETTLIGLPDGDDTTAMLAGVAALGAGVNHDGVITVIAGCDGRFTNAQPRAHAALAGTTSRFLTALAARSTTPVVVDGATPLRARPMAPLHQALRALGAALEYEEQADRLPVSVVGPVGGGTVALPGDVSSQFISALMMIGPYLDDGLHIELTSPLVSVPYVELTATVMADFGVRNVRIETASIDVGPGRYAARDYAIEPDASSASYPFAIAAAVGGEVGVPGFVATSRQGDVAIVELLARMGCTVIHRPSGIAVRRDPAQPLLGIDADLADVSDLVPTIAVVAALASTPTTIRGVGFIRNKESDRLGDLAAELHMTGANVAETPDGLRIEPVSALHGASLNTHHDHRLAMAFAVLGSAVDGITVNDPDVVTKSWPGFWSAYDQLLGVARPTPRD